MGLLSFLEKKTTAILSQYIVIGLSTESTTFSRPLIKFLNQIACLVAVYQPINLASMVEEAVAFFLELFHETTPSANKETYPLVDFQLSTQPAKSESE